MPAIYVANPIDVDNRLELLGWTRGELLEVVSAMVAARRSCTDNDPSSAPGWMSWKEGTRRIREIGRRKGLHKDEFDQIPCVFDAMRKLRFSVSNTDDGTAIEDRIPQNRSKKGPGTESAASGNHQSLLDDRRGGAGPEKARPLQTASAGRGFKVSHHRPLGKVDMVPFSFYAPTYADRWCGRHPEFMRWYMAPERRTERLADEVTEGAA